MKNIKNSEFVNKLSILIMDAKPMVAKCEYLLSNEEEIVIVTCKNGYEYKVNVAGDSLIAIAIDVLKAIQYK